jgi:hypothetical protein
MPGNGSNALKTASIVAYFRIKFIIIGEDKPNFVDFPR